MSASLKEAGDSVDMNTGAMYEMKQVTIPDQLNAGDHIQFVALDLSVQPSLSLAVAYYAVDGQRQTHGLRLDLDKRIMLDSLEDIRLQDEAQQSAERFFRFMATEEAAELIKRSPSQFLAVQRTSSRTLSAGFSAS